MAAVKTESGQDAGFWKRANQYASSTCDDAFVSEMAYMMVTLHRAGA